MVEGFIEFVFLAIIFIILLIIFVAFSVKRDSKKEAMLISYLTSNGFSVSGNTDIPDMQNSGKPYKFLVDFVNKKWVYAKYRAETSNIYNFSDIISYNVILRSKGTKILMGEKRIIESDHTAGCSILKTQELNENNCDHIAVELKFKGRPADEVDTLWVMYENQDSGGDLRRSDFLLAGTCIRSAVQLEQWLYEILRSNNV